MFTEIFAQLAVGVSSIAVVVIVGVLSTFLKQKYGLEIDEKHRDALHRAAVTVAHDFINQRIVKAGTTHDLLRQITNTDLQVMAEKMKDSVPDAFQHLKPQPPVLKRILLSKVR